MSKTATKKRAQDAKAHTLALKKRLKSSDVSSKASCVVCQTTMVWPCCQYFDHEHAVDVLQEILAEVRKLSAALQGTTQQQTQ